MILFLYGEDAFRSRQKLFEYKERFLKKYGPQGSFQIIDAEERKDFNFPEVAKSGGLFSPVRLIIIKNFLAQFPGEKQEKIAGFLKSDKTIAREKDSVIIFWEEGAPKKTNVLFKYLDKNAKLERFEKLEGAKLNGWINSRLKEVNPAVGISRLAAEKLAAYAAGATEQLDGEILKLANYKNSGEISESDVDKLVPAALISNIFETVEAASSGNKKRALALLHKQLKNKEDAFYVLSMYVYQFRNLLKIGEYFFQGATNRFDVAKKAGLHPYVIQKTLPQLKNFTLSKLKNIYNGLQEIDLGVKTGKIDIGLALDKFLVEL